MVSAGTILRFDARGVAGGWTGATQDSVRSAIVAELSKTFTVVSCRIVGQGAFYELLEWDFIAQISIELRSAYGDTSGPASIVAHAVYAATGNMPTVGPPDSQGTANAGGIMDTIGDVIEDVSGAVAGEFNFILIAVAVVAIVLVVRVGGKTTRLGLS